MNVFLGMLIEQRLLNIVCSKIEICIGIQYTYIFMYTFTIDIHIHIPLVPGVALVHCHWVHWSNRGTSFFALGHLGEEGKKNCSQNVNGNNIAWSSLIHAENLPWPLSLSYWTYIVSWCSTLAGHTHSILYDGNMGMWINTKLGRWTYGEHPPCSHMSWHF